MFGQSDLMEIYPRDGGIVRVTNRGLKTKYVLFWALDARVPSVTRALTVVTSFSVIDLKTAVLSILSVLSIDLQNRRQEA